MDGHYVNRCRQWEAQLVEALNTSCSISGNEASAWFLDTEASAHMTLNQSLLDQSVTYTGKDCVMQYLSIFKKSSFAVF